MIRRYWWLAGLAVAAIVVVILAPLASSDPDGLERVAIDAGFAEQGTEAGYQLLGHFTLSDAAWWDDYYTPLKAKLPALRERYRDDEEALALVRMTETEISMREQYGSSHGYEFFIARVDEGARTP